MTCETMKIAVGTTKYSGSLSKLCSHYGFLHATVVEEGIIQNHEHTACIICILCISRVTYTLYFINSTFELFLLLYFI